jgi:hypothetical protein
MRHFRRTSQIAAAMASMRFAGVTGSAWNPSDAAGTAGTFSNSNKTWVTSATNESVRGTSSQSSGKWYFEVVCNNTGGSTSGWQAGAMAAGNTLNGLWTSNTGDVIYRPNGQIFTNGGGTFQANAALFGAGDVIGFAINVGVNCAIYKNNVFQFTATYTAANPKPYANSNGSVNASFTLRTAAADQSFAPPATYTAWG